MPRRSTITPGTPAATNEAIASWKRLLSLSRAAGDSTHQGWALAGLAYQDDLADRSAAAEGEYRESLALFHDVGDHRGEAHAWNGLGTTEQAQGRYADAIASYKRAAAIALAALSGSDEGKTVANELAGLLRPTSGRATVAVAVPSDVFSKAM